MPGIELRRGFSISSKNWVQSSSGLKPRGDAVVGIVGARVVYVVVLFGEDQTTPLEPGREGPRVFHVRHLWNWFVKNFSAYILSTRVLSQSEAQHLVSTKLG